MYITVVRVRKQCYKGRQEQISEGSVPQTSYKISEARKNFAEVLERANQGEEIVIMRGNEIYARIGPADGGKRPFGLLRQRGLPDDLFDESDAEQAAIDAGDWNDEVGVWQGGPASPKRKA
ncbi:prevent-host-death family protein [Rhizobium mesoamericanum]|nr:prevent-host-death family protein [Rhizobium mesoamericanum]